MSKKTKKAASTSGKKNSGKGAAKTKKQKTAQAGAPKGTPVNELFDETALKGKPSDAASQGEQHNQAEKTA